MSLAKTAKTRGSTLQVSARDENFAEAEKISIFQDQGSQRIAETSLGVEKHSEDSGSEVLKWKCRACI